MRRSDVCIVRERASALSLVLALLLAGCASVGRQPTDACSLLTADDLLEVQGETPVEVKPSEQGIFHQCFYRLPTFTSSINTGVATDAREFWEKTFRENAVRGEEEAELRPVSGIGEEARWSALPIGATLYVLEGETMIRIGIGGKGSDDNRREKAIALARRMLQRLRR